MASNKRKRKIIYCFFISVILIVVNIVLFFPVTKEEKDVATISGLEAKEISDAKIITLTENSSLVELYAMGYIKKDGTAEKWRVKYFHIDIINGIDANLFRGIFYKIFVFGDDRIDVEMSSSDYFDSLENLFFEKALRSIISNVSLDSSDVVKRIKNIGTGRLYLKEHPNAIITSFVLLNKSMSFNEDSFNKSFWMIYLDEDSFFGWGSSAYLEIIISATTGDILKVRSYSN